MTDGWYRAIERDATLPPHRTAGGFACLLYPIDRVVAATRTSRRAKRLRPNVTMNNITLGKWIGIILFLRLVSVLVSQTDASSAAFTVTSLVGMAFILKLSWTLLSRHILPYRVQDQVSYLMSFEYAHVVAACISHWREHLRLGILEARRLIRVSLESIRHAVRRETQIESIVIEMDATTSVPSLEAPMSHAMERDTEHEEDAIPPLQDKKKS